MKRGPSNLQSSSRNHYGIHGHSSISVSPPLRVLQSRLEKRSLIKVVDTLQPLLHQHVLHLSLLKGLSQVVYSPESSFDDSKLALERWLALSRGGERWEVTREWEELIDLELTGYGLEEEESSEEEVRPRRRGKGSKK